MNKFLLFTLLFVGSVGAVAQNKTLGVGTATPNPNAALHVESPTNNQGMIIPRLTTAQRNTMTGILTITDAGLMLYDTNVKAVYTWDGTAWKSSSKIQYPSVDTISNVPPSGAALGIALAGSTAGNFGVANFQNMNPNNGFSTLFVTTNSNTNGATDMIISNPNNINDVVGASTNGKGTAGRFTVNNPTNRFAAVYATTNGVMGSPDSSAAVLGVTSTAFSAVTGKAIGPNGSNGVTGLSNSSNAFSFAVYGNNTGNGVGGRFDIGNAANTSNALEAQTNGTGGAAKFKVANAGSLWPAVWAETNSNQPLSAPIFGLNTGTGDVAASFKINNAASTFPALYAETNGTGRGAFIRKTNTGGSQPGLFVSTEGGRGIWVDHNGAAYNAGIFQIINGANSEAALFAESVGAGPSIWANKMGTESGNSFESTHAGTAGSAGNFMITSATNSSPALNVETNGTGFGVRSYSTGNEVAGYFQTANPAASTSTLFGLTNAPSGHAIGASNIANGSALSIFQGGMKISTFEVTTGTTIATRAAAYRITGGGPAFTISFLTSTGDIFMVYNDTAGTITFEGVSIPTLTGKTVINFNSGSFRGL